MGYKVRRYVRSYNCFVIGGLEGEVVGEGDCVFCKIKSGLGLGFYFV